MEQPTKQVENEMNIDMLLDRVMEVSKSDNPYVQKIVNFIDKSTTTNEVCDVLAFLRMSTVLDEGKDHVTLFGHYGLGLKTYAEIKIKKLQRKDKRKGLSLIQ